MVGKISNILTVPQNTLLQSMKKTQGAINAAQEKLASGKDVNSALDNPLNFFTSRALSQKAGDFTRILDEISLNLQVIKAANAGAEAILQLIDQAGALLDEAELELYPGEDTVIVSSLEASDISAILAANPGVIYSAASESFYRLGAPTNWNAANAAAQIATLIEPAGVTGIAGVTGHLANITSAAENAAVDALVPANAWLGGNDSAVEGVWRWIGGPEAGEQFWQGTAGGTAIGGYYTNWGAGEPNNAGNEDHVHMRPDGMWNDQQFNNLYNYVIEWDSSLFVTTTDDGLVERAREYAQQYEKILDQITLLAKDTEFRGLQLLMGESMRTDFNPERTSFLLTEGMDATAQGLGLMSRSFLKLSHLDLAQEQVKEARKEVRGYIGGLAVDLNVITVRFNFTRETIDVHKSGASALTDDDKNETGAEILALQVRQQLQISALQLATQSFIQRLF